jgi:phosphoserine phosphatase RsbU/P
VPSEVLTITRTEVAGIMLGTVFLLIGLAALGIAAVRRGAKIRLLVWQGVFSALYGLRILADVPASLALLPAWAAPSRDFVIAVITYLIIVPVMLFWLELSLGVLRRLLKIGLAAASLVAVAGIVVAFATNSPYRLLSVNNLLAVALLLTLATMAAVPRLARANLEIQSPVAVAGLLVAAAAGLYANLQPYLHLPRYPFLEPVAFALFILALGYVAAEKVFSDERRLLSIEDELAVAREIQNSILPGESPQIERLQIHAAYQPMTKVAGDFYEFIPVDSQHAGFLVADVSGHGVPAALIAAMVKVAVQSVVPHAAEPREMLRGLNRMLTRQLRAQFVSAAYLWLDTEKGRALYSAAGHPPLVRWRDSRLERFESNGLLIGVTPNADYPVRELELKPGDRFLLYTDGLTEPENATGDSFGEHRLEHVLRNKPARPPAALAQELLWEICRWQPAYTDQQDDITLIVIDVA